MGAGISRNIGIIIQKENYIAFLDADDIWQNDKLNKQINFMKKIITICLTLLIQ